VFTRCHHEAVADHQFGMFLFPDMMLINDIYFVVGHGGPWLS
jgi:hypothetical protein